MCSYGWGLHIYFWSSYFVWCVCECVCVYVCVGICIGVCMQRSVDSHRCLFLTSTLFWVGLWCLLFVSAIVQHPSGWLVIASRNSVFSFPKYECQGHRCAPLTPCLTSSWDLVIWTQILRLLLQEFLAAETFPWPLFTVFKGNIFYISRQRSHRLVC